MPTDSASNPASKLLKPSPSGVPLRKLDAAENFLIICIRLWAVENFAEPPHKLPCWRGGFEAAGLRSSRLGFDALMSLLFTSARPSLQIRYYTCPQTSEDERWLLNCATLAQQEKWMLLDSALGQRLQNASRKRLIPMLLNLSKDMLNVGMKLSFLQQQNATAKTVSAPPPNLIMASNAVH